MKTTRLDKQKKSIEIMIRLYCRKKHDSNGNELCSECRELLDYATMRINNCKYGDSKPNCGQCKIHCYKKDMREKIIEVMKYSGPRMLVYNPLIVIEHLIDKFKYK